MKLVLALDSFKGTLSAVEACDIVAEGVRAIQPAARLVVRPMADGGEGTADVFLRNLDGAWISKRVCGPLPERSVQAGFAWFPRTRTAVVEMAAASGLPLLPSRLRNPLKTTTRGTGQLLKAAATYPARRILLAVGGSATVDGGTGAAAALGWRFFDRAGRLVAPLGGNLLQIARIRPPRQLPLPRLRVLCDVVTPLCGPQGAARMFGPQKGATPRGVELLDRGLAHLADLIQRDLGRDVRLLPGGGAAGGLAAGAAAFFSAELVRGIDAVMATSRLARAVAGADWVITGEGRLDAQSWHGKVVSGVAAMARRYGVPVAMLAGSVQLDPSAPLPPGVKAVYGAQPKGMSNAAACAHARILLRKAAEAFAREYLL